MIKRSTSAVTRAWAALGGDPALVATVAHGGPDAATLPSSLPVREFARATVAVCGLAAAELTAVRQGGDRGGLPQVTVDDGAVATAFTSERHIRLDGRAGGTFAPLSRFWRTADGWVRTHANYPHHRARLLAALEIDDTGDDEALATRVADVLAERRAGDVEETVYAAGGLAIAVRTPGEWATHPQGAVVARHPLLSLDRVGEGPVRTMPDAREGLPAHGLRVLDLTRVLAGPVATRTLALLGADVLRIDPPHLPEDQDTLNDTGFGKKTATLDLTRTTDRTAFEDLLTTADVVVTGYRPGALDRHGLSAEDLAERHPGLVIGQLSAWGAYGPWGGRRGFDSLVQAATGIAVMEAGPDGRPGALPAQALDHGTGYLLAAAVLRALTEQHTNGGTRLARFALAQTAAWLTGESTRDRDEGEPEGTYEPEAWLRETDGPLGRLRYAAPPVTVEGAPADWRRPPGVWGTDPAQWG